MRRAVAVLTYLFGGLVTAADDPLIGSTAREWQVRDWINSRPLTLAGLRGKVLLVRWFTGQQCPFCSATAPALNEFHQRFASRGLIVVGFYHHKSDAPFDRASVTKVAAEYGFKFPVAIDHDWRTLHDWWLDRHDRSWTSVTFLIDRRGVVRHIHPGGQYVKGDKAYAALWKKIIELIEEPAPDAK
jgi:peroxiredoxin